MATSSSNSSSQALPSSEIPHILQALRAIHQPAPGGVGGDPNALRREATQFLEHTMQSPGALAAGFALAQRDGEALRGLDGRAFAQTVRYHGLSMMAWQIKHGGVVDVDEDDEEDEEDEEEKEDHDNNSNNKNTGSEQVRGYILRLAESLSVDDAPFLRNKVAELWVEVAKREWAGAHGWRDMDAVLVRVWESGQPLYIEFVLTILEALSDDIFSLDDAIAAKNPRLGSAFARICVTEDMIVNSLLADDRITALRFGREGWLIRIITQLRNFLDRLRQGDGSVQSVVLKILTTLHSILPWIPAKAIIQSNSSEAIGYALMVGDTQVRTPATEALCCIFSRVNITTDDMDSLLAPMFTRESLQLLQGALQWAGTTLPEDDEDRYTFGKKLSELLVYLGAWAEINPKVLQSSENISPFFQVFLEASKHPSIYISLPLLDIWLKLLRNKTEGFSNLVEEFIGSLLEVCQQRLIRYDMLPETSTEPTLLFLSFDCENTNQRDTILQRYRQVCMDVIESIVRRVPIEVVKHLSSEAVKCLQEVERQPFDPNSYSRFSPSWFQADSQLSTVDAAASGASKWLAVYITADSQINKATENKATELRQIIADYTHTVLSLNIFDPDIKKKLMEQAVRMTNTIFPKTSPIAVPTLETIMNIRTEKDVGSTDFQELSKELIRTCACLAVRMAAQFSDQFLPLYQSLEDKIRNIIAEEGDDSQAEYFAFLVTIIHRASDLDTETRTEKLRSMILPVKTAWEDADLTMASESYDTFRQFMGWDQLPEFLISNNFHKIHHWDSTALNEQGRQYQEFLLQRSKLVPIKLTKAVLNATTHKIEFGSPVFHIAQAIWQEVIPAILPKLLKMISYGTLFHNTDVWESFDPELKHCMTKILKDRFWQSGISRESRNAFVSQVSNSDRYYEGFGSTVRRTIRQIRAGSCDIILFFTKLGDVIFSIPNLADVMSASLYDDCEFLTPHHLNVLIIFSSHLINACPPHLYRQFLPPIVQNLFKHLRYKIQKEWEEVNRRTDESFNDENLQEEMKVGSILRSMTYTACKLYFHLLRSSPSRHHHHYHHHHHHHHPQPSSDDQHQAIARVLLSNPPTLEPLLLFALAALRVRDSPSVSCVLFALRDAIPLIMDLVPPDSDAATSVHQFLANELLKTAITSLHEPHFIDSHRDLAGLISLIVNVEPIGAAEVLASLPGAEPRKIQAAVERLASPIGASTVDASTSTSTGNGLLNPAQSTHRHGRDAVSSAILPWSRPARALVLELLESVKGVSIHEMGKMAQRQKGRRPDRVGLLTGVDRLVNDTGSMHLDTGAAARQQREITPQGLDGVAGLLGGEEEL